MGQSTNEVARPIFVAPETFANAALGKRRRGESHGDRVPVAMNGYEMPHQKRVRGNKENRILKTARSLTRTCLKPVARISNAKDNNEPKQPVRGAERLATPDPQRLHHRSLLGPNLQQEWAEEAADGRFIWEEGGVEEIVQHIESTVQHKDPQNLINRVQVATRGDASRLGTRGSSRDPVPALSQSQVQQIGRLQETPALQLYGDAPVVDPLVLGLRANGTAKIGPPSASN